MRIAIGVLSLGVLAGTVQAQCNVTRNGIPDFDQRRGYLAGNGSMYCVPTAALNLMGYIANHGQPQALKHTSSNWAAMGEYGLVDVRDYNMGGWMGTDAVKGTSGSGGLNGLTSYMNYYGVGPAIITMYYNTKDFQISPGQLWMDLTLNWPTSMCFGRYTWESDHWKRTGGHCLTVCAVNNGCMPLATVGFKDPNTNTNTDSIWTQSAFKTGWWDVTKQGHTFDGGFYKMWGPSDQAGADTLKYIDNLFVILPLFALTQDQVPGAPGLTLYTLPFLSNDTQPPTQHIDLPGGVPVRFADVDPRTMDLIVVGDPTAESPARLWKYSRQDGSVTPLLDLPGTPDGLTIDRRGDMLVGINGDLYKFHFLADGSVIQDSQTRLGIPLIRVAVDDKTDDVFVLSGRTLLKFPGGDLAGPPEGGELPAEFVPGDGACVAVNPADGMPWVCSPGSDTIRQVIPSALGGWDFGLLLPAIHEPSNLQFGDLGTMKFLSDGKIVEFDLDAEGRYVPSGKPQFGGLPGSRFFVLGRSRTNFDPRIHTGPAWDNIDDADTGAAETVDCLADYNGDGFLDPLDYNAFINDFEAGSLNADYNNDGFLDPLDYNAFINDFEAGC